MKHVLILCILTSGITLFLFGCTDIAPSDHTNIHYNDPNTTTVTISTDKLMYSTSEIISISVRNGLTEPILYSSYGDRIWGIEYFENDKWINNAEQGDGGFQITEEEVGTDCYITLYELAGPSELVAKDGIITEWTQVICPYDTHSIEEPRQTRYIESGTYRLLFYYGFETEADNPFMILNPQTAYSNTFVIK
jgi:hypothetical protein